MRREQPVGDVARLRLDQLYWNDTRPEGQQVELLLADMEFDAELKLAGMDRDNDAA